MENRTPCISWRHHFLTYQFYFQFRRSSESTVLTFCNRVYVMCLLLRRYSFNTFFEWTFENLKITSYKKLNNSKCKFSDTLTDTLVLYYFISLFHYFSSHESNKTIHQNLRNLNYSLQPPSRSSCSENVYIITAVTCLEKKPHLDRSHVHFQNNLKLIFTCLFIISSI